MENFDNNNNDNHHIPGPLIIDENSWLINPENINDRQQQLPEKKQLIPLWLLFLLNFFAFAFSLAAATFYALILPDEVSILFPSFPAQALAGLLAIAGVTQLITPVSGYLSDRTKSKRFGKRIPWIAFGTFVMSVSLFFIGLLRKSSTEQNDPSEVSKWFIIFFIFFNLGANVAYSAFTGLLPDLVPHQQIGEASGVLAVSGSIGALVGISIVSFVIEDVRDSYFLFGFSVIVACIITSITAMFITKRFSSFPTLTSVNNNNNNNNSNYLGISTADKISLQSSPISTTSRGNVSQKTSVFRICNSNFFWVWFSRLLFYISMSTQAWLLFFIRDLIIPYQQRHPQIIVNSTNNNDNNNIPSSSAEELTAVVLMTGMISSALVSGPFGALSDKIGRKFLVYLACTLMALVDFWWSTSHTIGEVLLGACFYGLATGCFLSVDLALAIETIKDKETYAEALGIWGIAAFFGSTVGPALSGPLLTFWGTPAIHSRSIHQNSTSAALTSWVDGSSTTTDGVIPNEIIHYTRLGYAAVLALSGIAVFLSGICITFVKVR